MPCLRCLCLFAYSGDQHILCCVFALFYFRFVCRVLPISLDCPLLIAPSVFSNIYLLKCSLVQIVDLVSIYTLLISEQISINLTYSDRMYYVN